MAENKTAEFVGGVGVALVSALLPDLIPAPLRVVGIAVGVLLIAWGSRAWVVAEFRRLTGKGPASGAVSPREEAPFAAQENPNARDRAQMAALLVVDRQNLAAQVSEIAGATITHPGGNQSYSIFDKAVSLRDRFMSEDAFPPLWQAFEHAVLNYLLYGPPLQTSPTDIKAQRAALAHEEKFRPPITAAAQALTRYLLYQD